LASFACVARGFGARGSMSSPLMYSYELLFALGVRLHA